VSETRSSKQKQTMVTSTTTTTGSFTRDPIRYDGGRSNLFEYCSGIPLSRRDPNGLIAISDDDGLPPLPDPLPPLGDAEKKCSCREYIKDRDIDVDGETDKKGKVKKCSVKPYCADRCPGGKPGFAHLPDNNGNIRLCMTSQMSEREYSLIFEHELQHARDFCKKKPPVKWDCKICETYESHAHEVNCGMLYPDDKDKRDSCVKCATYISCAGYCAGSKKPEGCTWELIGLPSEGNQPIPDSVPKR